MINKQNNIQMLDTIKEKENLYIIVLLKNIFY